jgi:beta-lactamase class A
MNRRQLLRNTLLAASVAALLPRALRAAPPDATTDALAALERHRGGRLGVSILDTADGRRASHRGDERFLMCSTFKALAVAAVLARVDRGEERLDRRVVFDAKALLDYAPVTRAHVGPPGMTVGQLCEAAITLSDNTAANLLLDRLGGPAQVTRFARSLGDRVTRLDRNEPALNVAEHRGDVRDTTTPDAMLATLRTLALGDALSAESRERLLGWMRACETGMKRLRAGLPSGWTAADKTGSGMHGETNDIAIAWRPGRAPVLVTAYYAAPASMEAADRSAVLAEVGRIAAAFAKG